MYLHKGILSGFLHVPSLRITGKRITRQQEEDKDCLEHSCKLFGLSGMCMNFHVLCLYMLFYCHHFEFH